MRAQTFNFQPKQRFMGVAATVAMHVGVIGCWLLTDRVAAPDDGVAAAAMLWIDITAPIEKKVPPPAPLVSVAPVVQAPPRTAVTAPAPRPIDAPALGSVRVPASEPVSEPVAPTMPAKSAQEMLRQARRDIGKIDKELNPGQHIKAPVDTAQSRLVKGIELANELAPPRWYEQSKVKELIDPGGYGRKRYRVITALGTYCITYDSPQSPDGRDPVTRGATPKYTNCPPHEEPAKPQK